MRTGTVFTALAAFFLAATAAHADRRPSRFRVGVTDLTFTKTSVTSGEPRVLDTAIWYPAEPRTGTRTDLGFRDAAARRGPFPLIVFSHGTCGSPTEASYLTTALAASGFVVAAPPHPGNTENDLPGCLGGPDFIDSAINRVPDVRFAIDSMLAESADSASRFAGRLRSDAIGMSGLSFGGFTALLAEVQEPRIRATLSMVPGGTATLGQNQIATPTMVIGSERDMVVGYAESVSAFGHLTGPRFLVELLAANHLSVVDDCRNPTLGTNFCVPADITQDEAHRLVLHYALPFFRRYLAGRPRPGPVLAQPIAGVTLQAEP